tara:strand:+ start:812 stop:1264 length:453 start_codon:yes stop_codon:yes gene_type:complete
MGAKLKNMRKEIKTFFMVFFGIMVGSILYYLLAFISLVIAYSGYKMASNAGATNFPHNISLGKKRMFQPSETFQGPYPGYIFTTDEQGTGYYPENYQEEDTQPIEINTSRITLGNVIFFTFSSISFILLLPIIIDSFIRILTFFALDEMF